MPRKLKDSGPHHPRKRKKKKILTWSNSKQGGLRKEDRPLRYAIDINQSLPVTP